MRRFHKHKRWAFLALLSSVFASPVLAQEEASPSDRLPPVIVKPEAESPTTPPTNESTTPSIVPPQNVTAADIERSLSTGESLYPSLSTLGFGSSIGDPTGLNSGLRGDKSIFNDSHLDTVVDRQTMNEKMSTDMFRALQNEVGVLMQATGKGQASPFIRGVTGQQVLVLVDGIRVNNQVLRSGPNQYFNTIDPGQVDHIEVIRGSGSVTWGGDALGGVINIVTRSADPTRGTYGDTSVKTIYGTADSSIYGRGNVEAWVGNQGIFGGVSGANVNDVDIGGGLGRQPFTDYDQHAGDIKYNVMVSDQQMVTFALSHFEQQDLPRSDRFAPFVFNRPGNTERPTFFDPQQRDLAYVRWQGLPYNENGLFDVFSLTASYTRTKEGSREIRSTTRTDIGEFTDDVFGNVLTLSKDLDSLGKVTYGGEWYHDDIDARRSSIDPTQPLNPSTSRTPQYPPGSYADRYGTFMNWDVQVTDRLNTVVGARFEQIDIHATPTFTVGPVSTPIPFDRTYDEWIGSVGLTYAMTDEWNLVGGVYEGFRSPTLDDLTATTTFLQNAQQNPVLASLNVQPEHSYTYEIGTKYNGEKFRIQMYEWWMTIDDYITRQVDGVGNSFLGNHAAYLNGTEIAGEYLLLRQWALYGNFAYTYGQDTTDNVPYSRIPPTQGILGLRWRDDSRLRYFDMYAWMVDRQDRYNPANLSDSRFYVNGVAATPGYATFNMRAGTSFGENDAHRVSVSLENITDKYYRVLGSGVDGTGASAILGYEFLR